MIKYVIGSKKAITDEQLVDIYNQIERLKCEIDYLSEPCYVNEKLENFGNTLAKIDEEDDNLLINRPSWKDEDVIRHKQLIHDRKVYLKLIRTHQRGYHIIPMLNQLAALEVKYKRLKHVAMKPINKPNSKKRLTI